MESPSAEQTTTLISDREALEAMFRDDTKGLRTYSPEDAAAFRTLQRELEQNESASVTPFETKSETGQIDVETAQSIGNAGIEAAMAVSAGSWQNPDSK